MIARRERFRLRNSDASTSNIPSARVGAGQAVEKIVDGSIFLNNNEYVRNATNVFRRTGLSEHGIRGCLPERAAALRRRNERAPAVVSRARTK